MEQWLEASRLQLSLWETSPRALRELGDQTAVCNWLTDAEHYDWLWRRYRAYHRFFAITIILFGVLTPLLVQAKAMTLATVSGAIVAVAAALNGFFNWGERIQQQRRVAEALKDEGVAFFTDTMPYDTNELEAIGRFKARLVEITEQHRHAYESVRQEKSPKTSGEAGLSQ